MRCILVDHAIELSQLRSPTTAGSAVVSTVAVAIPTILTAPLEGVLENRLWEKFLGLAL